MVHEDEVVGSNDIRSKRGRAFAMREGLRTRDKRGFCGKTSGRVDAWALTVG